MIYLDHHAATPLCPAARDAMAAAARDAWANPSSAHAAGRRARALLEGGRRALAEAIGAAPADLTLTSGGSEAVNLGVRGLARAAGAARALSSPLEHPAVLGALAEAGLPLRLLDPSGGAAALEEAALEAAGPDLLVALQWVNHETGIILPVERLAPALRARGAAVFVDATQALGKLPVCVEALGADAVAFAAHKLGGPAGAGALWVRRGHRLPPLVAGGGQERGLRAGSPDLLAAVGFGAAAAALPERLAAMPAVARRRDRLEAAALALGARVQGAEWPRVASATHLSFAGWRGPVLAAALDLEGLCASSGAACSSGLAEPSAGIRALYPESPERAAAALRLSLGPETRDEEVDRAEIILKKVIGRGP